MIDYESLSSKDRKELTELFSKWLDWFLEMAGIKSDTVILTDLDCKEFTVSDYARDIRETFGFLNPCKELLSGAYAKGGKEAALQVLRASAPLVIIDCNINNEVFRKQLNP